MKGSRLLFMVSIARLPRGGSEATPAGTVEFVRAIEIEIVYNMNRYALYGCCLRAFVHKPYTEISMQNSCRHPYS
jgi:hypothetical protein